MEHRLINLQKIEQLTGITFKTIKKRLQDSEVAPLRSEGKSLFYDSRVALPALYAQPRAEACDLTAERAKLARAQAEKATVETQKMLGNLVDKEEWCTAWASVFVQLKDRLLSIALKVSSRAANKTAEEVYAIIDAEVRETINELRRDAQKEAREIELAYDNK